MFCLIKYWTLRGRFLGIWCISDAISDRGAQAGRWLKQRWHDVYVHIYTINISLLISYFIISITASYFWHYITLISMKLSPKSNLPLVHLIDVNMKNKINLYIYISQQLHHNRARPDKYNIKPPYFHLKN